jgi:cell division protein FtsB
MILSPEGLPRVQSLERELAGVRQENDDARRQIAFLRKTVENLKDNPTAVERLARDELGLTRKNEVVFQFPRQK